MDGTGDERTSGGRDDDREQPNWSHGSFWTIWLQCLLARLSAVTQPSGQTHVKSVVQPFHSSWYRHGTVYEATRTTLDKQINWLHEIDDKAMRTLRFNVLLLGILVPGYSLAIEYGPGSRLSDLYNSDTALGIGCLITSVALAGLTYTASSIDVGVSADDVLLARRTKLSDRDAFDALVASHAEWIRTNRRVILWNSLLVSVTVLLSIYGIVFLSLGVGSALNGTVPTLIRHLAYTFLVVITAASRLL